MDAPARFSFDRGVPAAQYDEKVRRGSIGKGAKSGTTFISDGIDDEFYKPIASYEGIHRWDPDFEWEPEEEKKVVRKVCIFRVVWDSQTNAIIIRSTNVSVPGSVLCFLHYSSIEVILVKR